jgi:hypothetical protein
MKRRAFVSTLLSTLIAKGFAPLSAFCSQQDNSSQLDLHSDAVSGPAQPDQINKWMKAWKTRGYDGPLVLSRFIEPIYFLYEPIKWVPRKGNHDPQFDSFTVPKGFVTDMASIPRVFWSILRPDGNYAYSAILHDYLYWDQTRPRETADRIFQLSMRDFKISPSTVSTIYQAVRIGGQRSWDQNHLLKNHGESRYLIEFPTDPTVSWSTWKQDSHHFAG